MDLSNADYSPLLPDLRLPLVPNLLGVLAVVPRGLATTPYQRIRSMLPSFWEWG